MCTREAAPCAAGSEKIIALLQQQLVAQQESSAKVIEVLHQQLQQGSSKTFEVLHQELGQQRETDLKVSACQSLWVGAQGNPHNMTCSSAEGSSK